ESWQRGVTCYLPDGKAPLHPEVLSEGAASLLPGHDRPAVVWRGRVDQPGELTDATADRALVHVRLATSYPVVAALAGEPVSREEFDGDGLDLQPPTPDVVARAAERGVDLREAVARLAELGGLLLDREAARGGVSLQLPDQ